MTSRSPQLKNNQFYLLCFFSLLCIALILVPVIFQNDTFYTIKVGERIAKEGLLPIDTFTFLENLPYTYPHWLYDYGIYLLYQLGGFKAIYISSMVLTIILGSISLFISTRISGNRFVTYFVVCATLMSLSLNFTARAQLVTYIFFVVEYGLLYAYCQQKITRTVFFIGMLLISTLIVNIHCATWLLFYLIAIPFIAEKFISFLLINANSPFSSRIIAIPTKQYSALFIIITLFISILTGFLTPLGDTPFTYLLKTYSGPATALISEHKPLAPITNGAFMIFILQMTYLLVFTRCRFFARELLILFGLGILALLSIRQTAILLLINALIAPRLLTLAFEESCPNRLKFYTEKIGKVKGGIITLLILVLLCYASYSNFRATAKTSPLGKVNTKVLQEYDDTYPVKAMDYFEANIVPNTARIYTDYALGSYVLFRGFHPMLDSRSDLYNIEFNNKQDYLKDVVKLISFQTHYDDFFNQFNINYILLDKNDSLNTYIKRDDQYPIVYEDEEYIIYHRQL